MTSLVGSPGLPLAGDDATAPRQAAAAGATATATAAAPAAAASAATTAAAATAAAPATAAAAAAATARILLAGPVHPPAFLVKYKERAERHIRHFFLGEGEFVIRYDVLGRHVRCDRRSRRCGCAARQRQRPHNSAQHGDGFLHAPSLRCSLRLPHVRSSNAYHEMVVASRRYALMSVPASPFAPTASGTAWTYNAMQQRTSSHRQTCTRSSGSCAVKSM